ncbi:MAG: FAD-binding domain-containing [Lasallia pustulata]|uniref:FAD-binding domain-containing n=1 Tax=Lasallia pustulata TaxID=136370 RepID=A0A5M8PJN3_9LECA|nr:MAG: FAD-binding domain-containing [Lasallia pustulata]
MVLNEDQKVPFIGGGGIWSDIYPQLVPHNPTIMGSRVPGIGVGGFSTGGGINFCQGDTAGTAMTYTAMRWFLPVARLSMPP